MLKTRIIFFLPLLFSRKDLFSLRCPDLGVLSKVFVRHDNSGVGPSWFLEEVEVTEEGEGGGAGGTTRFPCGQWLEECEGCGGDLRVELLPEGSEERHKKALEGWPNRTKVARSRFTTFPCVCVYVCVCACTQLATPTG